MEERNKKSNILWKILFFLYYAALLRSGFQAAGTGDIDNQGHSVGVTIVTLVVIAIIYLLLGWLAGLAFEKKFFSRVAQNINLTFVSLVIVCFPLSIILPHFIEGTNSIFTRLILAAILFAIFVLICSPVLLAGFCYKKVSPNFVQVSHPYLRLFAIFILPIAYAAMPVYDLGNFLAHIHLPSFKAAAGWLLDVYVMVFLIEFALNKRIIPQKFWKITAIPFVIPYIYLNVINHDFSKHGTDLLYIACYFAFIVPFFILYHHAMEGAEKIQSEVES